MIDQMERYGRGELTPAEARELAQLSLDDPELFEDLTAFALAKASVASPIVVPFPKARVLAAALAAAAALALILFYSLRSPSTPAQLPVSATKPRPRPVLLGSAVPGQPVLLSSGLKSEPGGGHAPRSTGSIASIDNKLVTIDLGSQDGLAKGSEVLVLRADKPIGRLKVTAIFSDRAQARLPGGRKIQVKDQVKVAPKKSSAPARDPSAALNDEGVNRLLRGDVDGADDALSQAMAALTSKAGLTFARTVNNLGVLAELRGDARTAEAYYADALHAFEDTPDAPPQERKAAETNLARATEARSQP
jgi:hypothetical protein